MNGTVLRFSLCKRLNSPLILVRVKDQLGCKARKIWPDSVGCFDDPRGSCACPLPKGHRFLSKSSRRPNRGLNRLSERIPRSLTSTSSLRSEPFVSELKTDLLRVEDRRVAGGLASVYEMSHIPYGRRFPADSCRVFNKNSGKGYVDSPCCDSSHNRGMTGVA